MTAGEGLAPGRARPMDLGAILDGTFSLYRRYFVVLVGAVGVITVPVALLAIALGPVAQLVGLLLGIATPAIGAVVAYDVAVGTEPTIASVWGRVGRVFVPIVLTTIMVAAIVIVGLILLVIPGVLFYVWFSLSAQAIVIDDRRYAGAMRRSRQLVRGSWWRVFGILLVIAIATAILQGLVTTALQTVFSVAGFGSGNDNMLTGSSSDFAPYVIASTVARTLVAPITALASALLYFDLRLRREGTDIAAAVDALDRR